MYNGLYMVETIFIPAKTKWRPTKEKVIEISNTLPKKMAIAYSVQFQDVARDIKNLLSKDHEIYGTIQVLGCSRPKFHKDVQAILIISSGKFHAVSLAFETKLPVYVLDRNELHEISEKDLEIFGKDQKVRRLKYLNANKVGVLVSTKPEQQFMKNALDFKKKIKNKKIYLFLENNINIGEFENFDIDSWVNTACPRLDMNDSFIMNLHDLIDKDR